MHGQQIIKTQISIM